MRTRILAIVLIAMGASSCKQAEPSRAPLSKVDSMTIDYKELQDQCGIEATLPQMYIFKNGGDLVSTELGYYPGGNLNIASNIKGPAFDKQEKLKACVVSHGVDFDRWTKCGTDYCVVRIVPESNIEQCTFCGMTQSSLDAYFAKIGSVASYREIRIAN